MSSSHAHPRHELDPHLLHGVRMSLLVLLCQADRVEFSFARNVLEVSDSVLSRQATQLENLGYISVHKGHVGKRPRTWLVATAAGNQALASHLNALRRVADLTIEQP